jgi:hypothetical protein
MTPQNNQPEPPDGLPAQWIPALVLISVGALFLLNNLQIIRFHDIFVYWPVALVAWGIFKVVDQPASKDKVVGAILIGIGGILLMGNLGIPHMGWGDLWPLILIAIGVLMLTDRLAGPGMGWGGRVNRRADWPGRANWRSNRLHESRRFLGRQARRHRVRLPGRQSRMRIRRFRDRSARRHHAERFGRAQGGRGLRRRRNHGARRVGSGHARRGRVWRLRGPYAASGPQRVPQSEGVDRKGRRGVRRW